MEYLERPIDGKKIIWFKDTNRYSIVELPASEIIEQILCGINLQDIAGRFSKKYKLPGREAKRFVDEIGEMLALQQSNPGKDDGLLSTGNSDDCPSKFYSKKFYRAGTVAACVEYETPDLEYRIHPKFAHLETVQELTAENHFKVYMQNGDFVLNLNEEKTGKWQQNDAHYFTGKFSMELLNLMYARTEQDWMGVFHASALSLEDSCLMFLGDSGSGKSTLAAILMAAGFDLLADDFVPVDALNANVFYFPAAVSVKKKAIEFLSPFYPQLLEAKEYNYPGAGKTVRYLAARRSDGSSPASARCKALVFIKYKPGIALNITKMTHAEAFQNLVPDSWISPLPENAAKFLDWFLSLPCYRLTYSDNEMMVNAIHELLADE